MSEQEILNWVNQEIKLKKQISNIKDDFQNGYLFKEILNKLGYNFSQLQNMNDNRKDKALIQQNFLAIKDSCEQNFGINLKNEKISQRPFDYLSQIYKYVTKNQNNGLTQFSKNISNLSKTAHRKNQLTGQKLQDQFCKTMNQNDKHLQQSFQRVDKTLMSMPPKILQIEAKLERFREEKTRHEIKAKQLKDQDDVIEWELRQQAREREINKLKANNQYIKEVDRKIYDNWLKTENIKKQRMQEEETLQNFLTGKLKKVLQDDYDEDQKQYKQGLKYFKDNCQRQGIELKHNPDEEKKDVKKAKFSLPATMQKIKERTKYNVEARKARSQRRNKMMVDQVIQQEKVEKKKAEEDFLEKIFENCIENNKKGWNAIDQINSEIIRTQNRLAYSEKQNREFLEYFEKQNEISKLKEQETKEQRKIEWRQKQLEFMENNIYRKEKSRKKHNIRCGEVLNVILDLVEVCYKKQKETNSIQISQPYWDDLTKRFINGEPFTDEKKFNIFEGGGANSTSRSQQSLSSQRGGKSQQQEKIISQEDLSTTKEDKISKRNLNLQETEFHNYYNSLNVWAPMHEYKSEEKQFLNKPFNNAKLGDFLANVIDKLHPQQEIKEKPSDLPDYMPLRISLIGNYFAGKKTIANLIKGKYQIEIIDPEAVLKEALILAFPPVEDEADKKKKGKKDAKKGQEEEKKENPFLKELGVQINEYKEKGEQCPDEIKVKAIVIKIQEIFPLLQTSDLIQQVNEAEEEEAKRQEEIAKQIEDFQKKNAKKPGKDKKKPGKGGAAEEEEKPAEKTPQELLKEKIEEQKVFSYSKGYALINFPTNLYQSKLLEEALTGFIPQYDRLNQNAESKKQQISELAAPNEILQDNSLVNSGIDLFLNIETETEECIRRADGRRIDPTTEIIYHVEDNPAPDQKIADRLKELDSEKDNIEQFEVNFRENQETLFDFLGQFGREGIYQSLQVLQGNTQQYESFNNVDGLIEQVLTVKKEQFDILKQQYEAEQEQIRLKQEEEEQKKLQQQQEEEKLQKQQQDEENKENKNANENDNQQQNQEELEQQQQNNNKITDMAQQQQEQKENLENQQAQEQAQQYKSPVEFINKEQQEHLLNMWDDIQENYIKDSKGIFLSIIQHREVISQRAIDVQSRFLQIIQKKDDKQVKISSFQDNYNKFFEENSDIMRFSNARDELDKHLDLMYESLWDKIDLKKNLAQAERTNIVCSGWIESEIEQLFSNYLRLFQTEINKLHEIIELFMFMLDTMEGRPINEVQEHVILEPFINETPMMENEQEGTYPKVEILYQHYVECLATIHEKIIEMRRRFQRRRLGRSYSKVKDLQETPKYKCVEQTYKEILKYEKVNMKIRGLILKNSLISRIKEIRNLGYSLYNKMDDWIIFGLKQENDIVYKAITHLRNSIKEKKPASVGTLVIPNISEIYKPLNCFQLNCKVIQPFEIQEPERFSIFQLQLFFNEINTILDASYNVNPDALYNFITRRKNFFECSKNLPQIFTNISNVEIKQMIYRLSALGKGEQNLLQNSGFFSSMKGPTQQMQSQKVDFSQENIKFSFREFMTCVILLSSPLPNQQHLLEYKEQFQSFLQSQEQQDPLLSQQDFINIPAWFEEFENDQNLYEDGYYINRSKFIKSLLFDLYCFQGKEIDCGFYIQSLQKYTNLDVGTFKDLLFGQYLEDQ